MSFNKKKMMLFLLLIVWVLNVPALKSIFNTYPVSWRFYIKMVYIYIYNQILSFAFTFWEITLGFLSKFQNSWKKCALIYFRLWVRKCGTNRVQCFTSFKSSFNIRSTIIFGISEINWELGRLTSIAILPCE